MTKKELKQYPMLCRQIERLSNKIQNEEEKELDVVKGKVSGSSKHFPYIPVHMSVQMHDPKQLDASRKRISSWQQEKEKLETQKKKIEDFVASIPDTHARMIFQYHFLDGVSQEETGEIIGYTQGRVSQKINDFLKD